MITFFKNGSDTVYLVQSGHPLTTDDTARLSWLLASAKPVSAQSLKGRFVGPRKEMITPWSTNAVEICQNMGLDGIVRIEEFHKVAPDADPTYDPMLQRVYEGLKASELQGRRQTGRHRLYRRHREIQRKRGPGPVARRNKVS